MTELIQLDLGEGDSILVEVDDRSQAPVTRGVRPAEVALKTGERLEQVLGRLGPVVRSLVSEVRSAVDRPDEIELEFAVKLSTDANVIIARTGGEANFRILLRWNGGR